MDDYLCVFDQIIFFFRDFLLAFLIGFILWSIYLYLRWTSRFLKVINETWFVDFGVKTCIDEI